MVKGYFQAAPQFAFYFIRLASKCPVKQVVCEFAPHQPDESRKAFEFMDAEARNLDAEIPVYLP